MYVCVYFYTALVFTLVLLRMIRTAVTCPQARPQLHQFALPPSLRDVRVACIRDLQDRVICNAIFLKDRVDGPLSFQASSTPRVVCFGHHRVQGVGARESVLVWRRLF